MLHIYYLVKLLKSLCSPLSLSLSPSPSLSLSNTPENNPTNPNTLHIWRFCWLLLELQPILVVFTLFLLVSDWGK